jgi:two-component system sensor histidine kinase KdpD
MGLAIARGIVEAHYGKIWIEPGRDRKGTRVLFTLPMGDDDVIEERRYTTATVGAQ